MWVCSSCPNSNISFYNFTRFQNNALICHFSYSAIVFYVYSLLLKYFSCKINCLLRLIFQNCVSWRKQSNFYILVKKFRPSLLKCKAQFSYAAPAPQIIIFGIIPLLYKNFSFYWILNIKSLIGLVVNE